MLITILLQKRIEQKRIKATVQMVIVIVSNQEGGMVMPTRKHSQKMSVKRVKQKWRYINILGDSMLKHVKGWDLSAKLDHHHTIYVRNFSEAKVRSMKDYTKPCTREENLDHIILYVRTNDRNSDNSPERELENQLFIQRKIFSMIIEKSQSQALYRETMNKITRQN